MKKLLLFLLLPFSAFAQKDTSFWFAAPDVNQFLTGNPHDRPILLRFTTFGSSANITISIPANASFTPITIAIPSNSSGSIDLSTWADDIENAIANTIANKGILLRSSADITAYYEIVSNCNCNPELFSLKGRNALGNEFIIPSQTEWSIDSVRFPQAKAAFDIIATEDNTVINITPSKHLVGRSTGIPFTVNLNRGQTFSNQALYRNGISLLNGSIVTSSKPIAVTTYEDLLMADGPCADLAGDQLIPTAIWGSEFVVVKGDLTNKDKIIITAATNNTTIFLNGNATPASTINRGSSYEINLSTQPVSYIKTNNKVSVYHYTGVNCEIGSAVIPKINCTGSNDVAITRSIDEDAVVFITTRTGNQSAFTVNGSTSVLTAADFSPVPGSLGSYVFCKKNLNAFMPTGSSTRFINNAGKFQLGFLNGASPTVLSGCRYGFFSDFKSGNVTRSQVEICRLDSAQLNAFGGTSYQWTPSSGLSNTNTANPKASPNVTTDYKVIITTPEGCIDSAFIKVVVNSNCIPTAIPCNNWLSTPSTPSHVTVGQVHIPGNKITVETIFNRTTAYSGGDLWAGDLVSKHKDPTDVNYLLRPNSAEITTSNGYFRTPPVCEIELNKTYHVAMVYDGSTLKFYRNGYLLSQVAATGNLIQNNWKTRIGWFEPQLSSTNFIGYINEVRIWNVARTQSQLNTYVNSTLPTPTTQAGLLAYFSFDNLLNKQGNTLYDGLLSGSALINQTNTNCAFIADSCNLITTCSNDFSYKQDICNPLSIQFNSLGVTPVGTYWNFGDGNTITANANPIHAYSSTGNYVVRYGFQNGSCTDTVTKTISVNVLQDNIILTPDTTICYGSTKQLRSAPSLNFCWSPTTYLNNSLLANPVTSTPVPITYYLTVEIPGTNVITNGNFNGGNTGFTSGYNFAVNNTTEGEYLVGSSPQAWNAALSNCGDHTSGSGNMLLVNGSPVPNVKVWTQTVAVTPNTNYAFSSWIQALYPPNPAQLSFSINGADVGTLLTASLPTCSWNQFYTTWNSGSNTTALISIVNKNTIVLGNDFALDDISFAPVFIKRDSVKITIDTPLVKTIADTSLCKNIPVQLTATGAVSYSWLPAAGLSSASVSNPIATPADTTRYIVTGTNANGCTAKDSVMVYVKKLPVITRSNNDTICSNQSVQLLASGGINYAWTPVNTLNNPAIANPIATPSANTTYTVLVTGNNNCTNKDSIKITLKTLPLFSISPNIATCVNGKAQLNATGGSSYLWSPAVYLNNANIANPLATVPSNTLFSVLINDSICNLSSTLSTNVTTDLAPPVISASKSNDIDCVFSSVQLNASGANVYVWSPGTNLSNSTIANPVATPLVTQQYTVTGTDSISNCKSQDTITIFIKAATNPKSYIPNTFTPNGDGNNDCFRVRDFGTVKTLEIIIYNRYGNLVFQTLNMSDCWDGTYKGQPADVGNYVYYIKVLNNCGEEIKKGNLLLLR